MKGVSLSTETLFKFVVFLILFLIAIILVMFMREKGLYIWDWIRDFLG
jgi:hypothetical protein